MAKNALGSDAAAVLEGVDHPGVDFVAEVVKEDIVLVNHLRAFAGTHFHNPPG